jgi:type I restriction enzyme R subunit
LIRRISLPQPLYPGYTDYAAETARTLCPSAQDLRKRWADVDQRAEIIQALTERGISFDELAEQAKQPERD